MNRIRIAVISTITAAMILGSTLVFAAAPAADPSGTSAEAPSIATDLAVDTTRRGGGGGGGHLLK